MPRTKKEENLTPERERELEENAKARDLALAPYSDNLPYDRDRVVSETKFYMNQAAFGIVEAGKRLILLKANEGHGGFMKAVEDIGIAHRTATRFMMTAGKVANVANLVNSRSKLYALLDVPDEELKEFEESGTLFGADRDEIDSWGVQQMKEFIRKQKKQIEKGTVQLEAKETENAELKARLSAPVTEADAVSKLAEANARFQEALFLAIIVNAADRTERVKLEKATLLIHWMRSAEREYNQLMKECPDLDLAAVDSEGLPEGEWPGRLPGEGTTKKGKR